MIRFNQETGMVVVDKFDISDPLLVEEVCGYLDSELDVQLLSIDKTDRNYPSKHTFFGDQKKQIGEGVVISSYAERLRDCLIVIA